MAFTWLEFESYISGTTVRHFPIVPTVVCDIFASRSDRRGLKALLLPSVGTLMNQLARVFLLQLLCTIFLSDFAHLLNYINTNNNFAKVEFCFRHQVKRGRRQKTYLFGPQVELASDLDHIVFLFSSLAYLIRKAESRFRDVVTL